jgi:hypothetical protein
MTTPSTPDIIATKGGKDFAADYEAPIPDHIMQAARSVASIVTNCRCDACQSESAEIIATAINDAVMAERERCLEAARHFMGSLWSDDQNHVASLIHDEIRRGKA